MKKMFVLKPRYFGFTAKNLIVIILTLSNCVSPKAQLIQKDTNRAKPTVQNKIILPSENADRFILGQSKEHKQDGLRRAFHQNGNLKSEGSYTSGLKEGLHKEWDENGILLLEGSYIKGKANGLMKWFHEEGHLAGEGNMIDGIRVGKWKICDIQENGFCIEGYFKDGKRDGIWKIRHENARDKLWKEQTYKDDKLVSEKCWDEKGKEITCK